MMNPLYTLPLAALILLAPLVSADVDDFFSVKSNEGPYTVLPGDDLVVMFGLSNRGLTHPDNVTAYIDPCPVGWDCEEQVFSFEASGVHDVNLTIGVPDKAIPKKYTLTILLESDEWTKRGDDRLIVTVQSQSEVEAISYEEYISRGEVVDDVDESPAIEPTFEIFPPPEPELPEEALPAEEEEIMLPEEPDKPSALIPDIPGLDEAELMEGVERLESSSQFVEYASIVLLIVLVFVVAGVYMSFKDKEKEPKRKK